MAMAISASLSENYAGVFAATVSSSSSHSSSNSSSSSSSSSSLSSSAAVSSVSSSHSVALPSSTRASGGGGGGGELTGRSTTALIKRLSSPAEHVALLFKALEMAQKTLLITSYDVSHDALLSMNFYAQLRRALSRGVKVYIYYNDGKGADKEALKTLRKMDNVLCDEAFTHSKFLCVDSRWVSIGSYNWLSFHSEARTDERTEGTIVCYQRDLNKELIEDIWNHLRFYRNLQFDNRRALRHFDFDEKNHSTVSYDLTTRSELEYIPTLEQHCAFFQEILMKTKRKLVICSPFLSMQQCLEDIRRKDLYRLSQRGVKVYFVTSSQSRDYQALEEYLHKIHSENIYLIDHINFHLKTLIIDDEVIAEGSFNWLSATRNEESDFHNHEATLIVRGEAAIEPIANFYQSEIGQKTINIAEQKVSSRIPSIKS